MKDKIFEKLKNELPNAQKNVSLKNHTTFKIGGPAKYFFIAETREDLLKLIKTAKKINLPIFILGGGSNLLVLDKGFGGLVIKIKITGYKLHNDKIFVLAGTELSSLAGFLFENGFKGFEWAAGIPGTVGGAIFGHAQAFGEKISDVIENIEVLNAETLKVEKLTKKQCNFFPKNSIFKKNKNLIIISAVFSPKKDDKQKIQEKIKEFLNYRKNYHPMNFPSAGSVFINLEIKIKDKKLLEKFSELSEFNKRGVIPSGYLIEKCGLKGKTIGGAQISPKHANFIINLDGAKAKDVLKLIKIVKKKVKDKFGVNLEEEIQIIK